MSLPTALLIHPVTILRTYTDYVVPFTGGSAVFNIGETLTGADSGATGVIKSVSVTSGSWAESDAAGQVIVYSYSSTTPYTPAEVISDTGDTPGSATVSATPYEHVSVGERQETSVSTAVSGRFGEDSGTTQEGEPGSIVTSTTVLMLPAGTDIDEDDTLTSTNTGYVGTYRVGKVVAVYGPTALSHLVAEVHREVTA